ncbi:PadR family transcriptional regulator [Nocardioides sp.]|jgi:DNA-binding PadR family transcriptional regulator|uniref:PadR family transcriptional regulator n=1 Tax=Nocardioides sp. TaxID=35761 RepID=UPI002F407CA1
MSQDLPTESPDLPVTAYALLGLLTFGDQLTGYELKQRADNTLRFYWVAPAMSQIYTELGRLTEHGYVEPVTTQGGGRRTTAYRITTAGARALRTWIDDSRVGFPTLKHTVLLRLLIGHASDPGRMQEMLEEYVAELAEALRDLRQVRESLRGADAPGELFHYPSVVADWGLDYFTAETRHTRRALARLATPGEGER